MILGSWVDVTVEMRALAERLAELGRPKVPLHI